jgi:hypothetical protein
MAIMLILYSCATIHSAVAWQAIMAAFQNHGTSPALLTALTHPNLQLKILALVASFLSFLLADMIMVCFPVGVNSNHLAEFWLGLEMLDCLGSFMARCNFPDFGGNRWNRLVAIVVYLYSSPQHFFASVCAGLGLAGQIAVASNPNSTSALRLAPLIRFSTPFLSLSFAVTLYTTGLIVWRIAYVQRCTAKRGIKNVSSDVAPVLEILIESSALYAASLFVFVVLLAVKSPKQNYLQNIHAQIAVCSYSFLTKKLNPRHSNDCRA